MSIVSISSHLGVQMLLYNNDPRTSNEAEKKACSEQSVPLNRVQEGIVGALLVNNTL